MVSKLVGLRNEIITLASLGGGGVLGRAVTSAARAKANGPKPAA